MKKSKDWKDRLFFNINLLEDKINFVSIWKFKWNMFVSFVLEKFKNKNVSKKQIIESKTDDEQFYKMFNELFPKLDQKHQELIINTISKSLDIHLDLNFKYNKSLNFKESALNESNNFTNEYFLRKAHLKNSGPQLEEGGVWLNKADRNINAVIKHIKINENNKEILFYTNKCREKEFIKDDILSETDFRNQYFKYVALKFKPKEITRVSRNKSKETMEERV